MSAHITQNPWPAQTPPPVHHSFHARRRKLRDLSSTSSEASSSLSRRTIADWTQVLHAEQECEFDVGNDVFSCFPTDNTSIPQHEFAAFVWNSRHPDFTQTNLVNIYLFRADNLQQVNVTQNVTNPTGRAGYFALEVNDAWFGSDGASWNGTDRPFPFYWVITRSDKELDGTDVPQPVFSAVQTTYADSVLASMASTASAAAASLSSLSASISSASREAATAGVQSGAVSSSSFPHWAIAVIVVLGFLALSSSCLLTFCIIRRVSRRSDNSHRNSVESSSPMMAHAAGNTPGSPLLASAAAGPGRQSYVGNRAPSLISPDGASTISRVGSVGDSGPFSGADATIMADAFRQALRNPDFKGHPVEEGESPDNPETNEDQLLSQQLAEEGRDIRSVSSSRGVKVETLSDSGETAQ